MSCCAPGAEAGAEIGRAPSRDEILLASRDLGEGFRQTDLSVPDAHCAACIGSIERELGRLPGVAQARVNLSNGRVAVKWKGDVPPIIETLAGLGYPAHLFEPDDTKADPALSRLVRALAVAGFSAMNIMLLSVSIWSGADAGTRQAFHWISALLALPVLLYSGQVFFGSAWRALRHGRTNMDVPISIGVVLAFALSLYDTVQNGPYAYFDAATSLLFFLLIGRTLDHVMREKARQAVRGLARLAPRGATVVRNDGSRDYVPVEEIEPGMKLMLAAGDRVPVDGVVEIGVSDLDCSIVTGESAAQRVAAGSQLRAGMMNLTGSLTMTATASAANSFLSEMIRLMEAAEHGKARYRRLADRAARYYSPVVHMAAFLTFLGWAIAGGDWHRAISVAIAVLIITCPCALGLAVPMVQVVAARRLFEAGIMVKDGAAMERLAEIDTVIFDKTGTLTLGRPVLLNAAAIESGALAIASALAMHSNHPVSNALARHAGGGRALSFSRVQEIPGSGIEAELNGRTYRLGRASWAMSDASDPDVDGTALSEDGRPIARFAFEDRLRTGARQAVGALRQAGLKVAVLSGDTKEAVAGAVARLDIADYSASVLPADKVDRLAALGRSGSKPLMVGDGLNDAPALAAAHVSMAPATAADVGRSAADFVFLGESLNAVPLAIAVSREAGVLIRQNFALAIGYNIIAMPVAVAGYATPLIAALAMSLSSVVVVANALRLARSAEPQSGAALPHPPAVMEAQR
jgi:Cu2+-exporting ATPase